MIIKETWTDADILEAVNQCNNKKVLGTRVNRTQRKIFMALDIAQVYDSVNRNKLFKFLDKRV